MKDDQRNSKFKMTNKMQNVTTTKINNNLIQYNIKKIVQIGSGSAPGNLVLWLFLGSQFFFQGNFFSSNPTFLFISSQLIFGSQFFMAIFNFEKNTRFSSL